MKKVMLHGWLGKKFGHVFTLEVSSAAEAVRALCVQVPGFRKAMETARATTGCGFAIFYGMNNIEQGELHMETGSKTIRIVPLVIGAKNGGWLNVIIGAVIIVVSLVIDYWTGGAFGAATNYATYQMGAAMMIGGIVQLLTPVPKTKGAQDRPENTPSYTFNGPVNTQAQGRHIPVLYGENIVGSAIVSAGITVKDFSATYNNPVIGSGGGGWSGSTRSTTQQA